MIYTTRTYTGDYLTRQKAANADGAVCYYEQHLDGNVDPTICRSSAAVASNASQRSIEWALTYAGIIAEVYAVGDLGGLQQGSRGEGNLVHTTMPAIIGEAGHVSNCEFREWLDGPGVDLCAMAAALAIRARFPEGGLVALSVGHLGKVSAPDDRGAPACGGGWEAEYCARIVERIPLWLGASGGVAWRD